MRLSWKMNKLTLLLVLLVASLTTTAQNIPEPMYPYRLVNDFANVFSNAERDALEQKLLAYNDSTSTQIYVVTIDDLQGYPISDYSFRLGEQWGVGQKSKNNGAVILIKPKTQQSKGEAFIALGYGLEARLTDGATGRIIRNEMIPYFRENDYFGGTNAAIDNMIARLSGEFDNDGEKEEAGISPLMLLLLLIVFILLIRYISRNKDQFIDGQGNSRSRGGGGPIIFTPSPRNRGPWSGGGFGGGSFGGGGFGGFGGGGGGSFGGGGAGGSW